MILALAVVAGVALVGFLARELLAKDPILDLRVFTDRNFAFGATFIALIGLGMFSSMVLLALSQKLPATTPSRGGSCSPPAASATCSRSSCAGAW
jgi:DHA2 family multidrug resistance protein